MMHSDECISHPANEITLFMCSALDAIRQGHRLVFSLQGSQLSLYEACAYGREKDVQLLIASGANPNQQIEASSLIWSAIKRNVHGYRACREVGYRIYYVTLGMNIDLMIFC